MVASNLPPVSRFLPITILAVMTLAAAPCAAAPTGINLGFENGNTGWTFHLAGIETGPSHDGTHHADLRNGHIEQTFTGLTPGERHTLRLVEHKMDVVRELADRIIVLHQGKLVADGDPATVIASPIVQEAYLGVAA